MLNLSDNFKNDIILTGQTLTPVAVITDQNDNILYTFSTHNLKITNVDVDPILKDVSKVKINTDYDKKNIKANTLRANIYNYYDTKDRLTDIFDIVSKRIYLFYKSPLTRTINFTDEINDTDCALVYKGRITRVEHNQQIISILAEDSTQAKINDKSVPYMTQDKLSNDIRDGILEEYKDDKITIPMVFGSVDKSPVLPYLDKQNARAMNLLFDIHPTAGYFKTSKIPKVAANVHPDLTDYFLYIKRDKDYIIWNHINQTYFYQNNHFSKVRVYNYVGDADQYLLSHLQDDFENEGVGLWSVRAFAERQVDFYYTGDGSILDIRDLIIGQSEQFGTNLEKINDNGGFRKVFYRQTDPIANNPNESYAHLGYKIYTQADNSAGDGRFILLKLDKGVNDILINSGGGNTFLLANYETYNITQWGYSNPNRQLPDEVTYVGWHVAPISTEVWRERVPEILSRITSEGDQDWEDLILHLLIETEEDLMNHGHPYNASGLEDYAPEPFTYQNSPIRLPAQALANDYIKESKYFSGITGGSTETDPASLKNIQGLYYGAEDGNVAANTHDYIAIFEYYPRDWYNDNHSYEQGLRIDNIGFLQSVRAENIREDEIFASIIGRKSNYYTEEVLADPASEGYTTEGSLLELTQGNDTVYPDFANIIDVYYNAINFAAFEFKNWDSEYWSLTEVIYNWANPFFMENQYGATEGDYSMFQEAVQIDLVNYMDLDDSAVYRDVAFFNMIILKTIRKICDMWDKLYNTHGGCLDNEYTSQFPLDMVEMNHWAFDSIFESEAIKAILKRVLEYVYQQNIDVDFQYNWNYLNPNFNWEGSADGYSTNYEDGNINLTDSVNFQYNWDSFNIVTPYDWIGNMDAFLDDTIYTINVSILENLGYNGIRAEKYKSWTGHWSDQTSVSSTIEIYPELFDLQYSSNTYLTILEDLNLTYSNLFLDGGYSTTTDGIIEKPSDIVMNIMCYELGYGRRRENQDIAIDTNIAPDYDKFDMESIEKSRDAHTSFKMGFAINEQIDAKKLIENILKESKSYPTFSSDGKFGLMTIKESYTLEDIDREIDIKDVLKHKISKTKQEDLMTSCKMMYRFNNGTDNYDMETSTLHIEELLVDYTGYDSYGITQDEGHKDIKLRYHTDIDTVNEFQRYRLLNECNVHNLIDLTLPLSYMDLNMGDIIHIPLNPNQNSYGIDFSKVTYLNGQHVYPLFIIMGISISSNSVQITGYQLHYLGTDGDHKFGVNYDIIGCTEYWNTKGFQLYDGSGNTSHPANYDPIANWNYNPLATVHNNIEIPFYDINGDGIINVIDIIEVANHILGEAELTNVQKQRLSNINWVRPVEPDVTHITKMIYIILELWND